MVMRYTGLESITTVLSTELNGLTDGAVAISGNLSNDAATTERLIKAMAEIYIATQGTARSAGASVTLFLIPTTDGTNYGDTDGDCVNNYIVGVYPLDGGSTAARYISGSIALLPTDYRIGLRNDTGQTLAATGNTVKLREYSVEDV